MEVSWASGEHSLYEADTMFGQIESYFQSRSVTGLYLSKLFVCLNVV